MENEIWRFVVGFENTHEVSSFGRVRRSLMSHPHDGTFPGKLLKPESMKDGYIRYTLHVSNKPYRYFAHRLVAKSFIENPENKSQVNHINGIKNDNRLANLEWVTQDENWKHAIAHKLWQANGSRHPLSKLDESQVIEIRNKFNTGNYTKMGLGKDYGVSNTLIKLIVNGKVWKHI